MHAFVVLSLVFSTPSQKLGLGKRLRNDVLCEVGRETTTQAAASCRRQASAVNEPVWLSLSVVRLQQLMNPSGRLCLPRSYCSVRGAQRKHKAFLKYW